MSAVGGSLPLRPYQQEALEALARSWSGTRRPTGEGAVTRAAVVLPTGMGKTVIFSHLSSIFSKPVILVHRDELVQQAVIKVRSVSPHKSVGIVKASTNELGRDITVASVQTLSAGNYRRAVELALVNGGPDLIIVDEAHHAAARTWRGTMEHLGSFDGIPTAGFTATMDRADSKHLGDIWEEVVYRKDILDGIRGGFLVDVRGKRVHVMDLDLGKVKTSRGDLQTDDLGNALMNANAGVSIANAVKEFASDRQTVVFAPSVESAWDFCDALIDAGFSSNVVTGNTPLDFRQKMYDDFRTGELQVLVNCMVLTEGWDAPWASCAVIARPTTNNALYTQMVGRVLRPWTGKTDALVLDVVGASEHNKLATLANLSKSTPRGALEDETLTKAASRAIDEMEYDGIPAGPTFQADGPMVAKDFDPFAASKSLWLKTSGPKAILFIPTTENLFFLFEEEQTWTVGRRAAKGKAKAERLERGLTLEYAMAWAEKHAADDGSPVNVSSKKASWRRGAVTTQQLDKCRQLGIPVAQAASMSKADVSDLISTTIATRLLGDK